MDYRPIVTNFIRAVHPNLEKSKNSVMGQTGKIRRVLQDGLRRGRVSRRSGRTDGGPAFKTVYRPGEEGRRRGLPAERLLLRRPARQRPNGEDPGKGRLAGTSAQRYISSGLLRPAGNATASLRRIRSGGMRDGFDALLAGLQRQSRRRKPAVPVQGFAPLCDPGKGALQKCRFPRAGMAGAGRVFTPIPEKTCALGSAPRRTRSPRSGWNPAQSRRPPRG